MGLCCRRGSRGSWWGGWYLNCFTIPASRLLTHLPLPSQEETSTPFTHTRSHTHTPLHPLLPTQHPRRNLWLSQGRRGRGPAALVPKVHARRDIRPQHGALGGCQAGVGRIKSVCLGNCEGPPANVYKSFQAQRGAQGEEGLGAVVRPC